MVSFPHLTNPVNYCMVNKDIDNEFVFVNIFYHGALANVALLKIVDFANSHLGHISMSTIKRICLWMDLTCLALSIFTRRLMQAGLAGLVQNRVSLTLMRLSECG
jgi:hypothetical protein